MRHSHTGLVEPKVHFLSPTIRVTCNTFLSRVVDLGRFRGQCGYTDTSTAVFSGLATHEFWSPVYFGLLYCFDIPSSYLLCNHIKRVFPSCRYNVPRVFLNVTCVATIFVAYPTGKPIVYPFVLLSVQVAMVQKRASELTKNRISALVR